VALGASVMPGFHSAPDTSALGHFGTCAELYVTQFGTDSSAQVPKGLTCRSVLGWESILRKSCGSRVSAQTVVVFSRIRVQT